MSSVGFLFIEATRRGIQVRAGSLFFDLQFRCRRAIVSPNDALLVFSRYARLAGAAVHKVAHCARLADRFRCPLLALSGPHNLPTIGCTIRASLGHIGRIARDSSMVLNECCARARLRRVLARTSSTPLVWRDEPNIAPSCPERARRSLSFAFVTCGRSRSRAATRLDWYMILTT